MSRHYDIKNFERIIVTRDVKGADGRLLVEKGAEGRVSADDRGHLSVVFDDSEHFVELSGCRRRMQSVPRLSTRTTYYPGL